MGEAVDHNISVDVVHPFMKPYILCLDPLLK